MVPPLTFSAGGNGIRAASWLAINGLQFGLATGRNGVLDLMRLRQSIDCLGC
jgi:hypothetical protein